MNVGERKYPHPLITVVAVLVTALALSAVIWAETGWPWRSDVIEIEEGTEEAEASSYNEFNGVRTVLPRSEYGDAVAANPFTFAITPRYLVFPNGERFQYEIAPGNITARRGLPLEALKRLNPGGNRASLYIDEYTPMILLYHLMPQFLDAGFSGFDFILAGPEGEIEWQVHTSEDLFIEGPDTELHCLYWDRRIIQLATPYDVINEMSTDDYLFLSKRELREVIVGGFEMAILLDSTDTIGLLPGANTTFGELVAARDALWNIGNRHPALAIGFDDPAVEPFMDVLDINPGVWVYDIQPTEDNPPVYYIE